MADSIKVVLIEGDIERAQLLVDDLCERGGYIVTVLGDMVGLSRKISEIDPDVVLVDVMNPSRDVLEELTIATSPRDRAVAIFANNSDQKMMRTALEAGVSAYVVNGLEPERLRPIVETAITRFNLFSRLQTELETTRTALAERKTIDRAKGILMKARGVDEEAAYKLLQKSAMDHGKKIAEISASLISAAELLE